MGLIDYTDRRFIKFISATDKYTAIEELAQVFRGSDICADVDKLTAALKEREKIMTTGIGFEIAVPHARTKGVNKIAFAIGLSREGIDFDAIDSKPVHLIILVAAGETQHLEYLRLLSRIMDLLKKEHSKKKIINADNIEQIIDIIKHA